MGLYTLEEIVRKNLKTDGSGRRDLCTIYHNFEELRLLVKELAAPYKGNVDYVAAPESVGFILGGLLAAELKVGFIPIRNGNVSVLTDDVIRASYIDHRNNARALQMRKSNLPAGSRVLLADDWVETAATMQGCMAIMEQAECTVVGIAAFGANRNDATASGLDSGMIHVAFCE